MEKYILEDKVLNNEYSISELYSSVDENTERIDDLLKRVEKLENENKAIKEYLKYVADFENYDMILNALKRLEND